jgi:hypothetical protein
MRYLKEDLSGKVFGNWTVLELDPNPTCIRTYKWVCKCACGKIKSVLRSSLIDGMSTSCGGSVHRLGLIKDLNHRWKGYGDISASKWSSFKESAGRRNIEFEISIIDGWEQFQKQKGKCALSGMDIWFYPMKTRNASLDRIDSSKGYVKGNFQWLHKDINIMKYSFPENIFIDYCTKIYYYHNK